ncbi:MAG: XVIPCD domain-containing protein, partial [Lysobacter sp.]
QRPHTVNGGAASTIGHELQHCLRSSQVRGDIDAAVGFNSLLGSIDPNGTYDYTDTVRSYVQTMREDEAHAEIGGWNAHLDIVKHNTGKAVPDANDIYNSAPGRMDYYFQSSANGVDREFKPEIQAVLGADRSMLVTGPTIAAISQNYFDILPHLSGLGPTRASNYPHYYAAMAISDIHGAETTYRGEEPPPIHVDLGGLGLNPATLTVSGTNLGAVGAPIFADASAPNLGVAVGPIALTTPLAPPPIPMPDPTATVATINPPPVDDGLQAWLDGLNGDGTQVGNYNLGLDIDPPLLPVSPPPPLMPLGSDTAPIGSASPLPLASDDWLDSLLNDWEPPSPIATTVAGTTNSVLGKHRRDDEPPNQGQGNSKASRGESTHSLPQQAGPLHASAAPANAAEPPHPLYRQALDALQANRDPELSSLTPDKLRCLAAGLACEAQKSGLERIDHVVASKQNDNVFAIQGSRPDDPSNRHAHVDQQAAGAKPLQQSLAELSAATPSDATRAQGTPSQQPNERPSPSR